jgi:CelD/BcsL family acetyltransferase involved in cellulose biosynthesis
VDGGRSLGLLRLRHVRSDARIGEILGSSKPWSETREHAGGIPLVWNSGEQWLQSCSKKMRDNVKYKMRRMRNMGFEARPWSQEQGCDEVLDILAAQKRPWLAQRSLSGPICTAVGLEFLKLAAAHAAARGELYLSVVANAECIAAVDVGFVRSGRIYSYMASFDERFAKYSFGRLLTEQFIMWSCDQGMGRFDLMLGAYDYKSEYGCTLEPVTTQVIARSLLGRAAVTFYRRSRKPRQ